MSNKPSRKTKQPASADKGGRIVIRAQPRAEPDLRRLARALIELARQELEAEQADLSRSPGDEEAA